MVYTSNRNSSSPIKTPSYSGFIPASESSSRAKRNNRRQDTKHELSLRRELWHMGLRFRKNVSSLPGKPDIVFRTQRVVVFCDGDFWHGRNWKALKRSLSSGTNHRYWVAKIESNRKRDALNNARLKKAGWHVIRLWETDINLDPLSAAQLIKKTIQVLNRKMGGTKSHTSK